MPYDLDAPLAGSGGAFDLDAPYPAWRPPQQAAPAPVADYRPPVVRGFASAFDTLSEALSAALGPLSLPGKVVDLSASEAHPVDLYRTVRNVASHPLDALQQFIARQRAGESAPGAAIQAAGVPDDAFASAPPVTSVADLYAVPSIGQRATEDLPPGPARAAARFGVDLARDPLTYGGLGVLGKAGKVGGAVEKAIAAAFALEMAKGTGENLAHAVDARTAAGGEWTPEAQEAATDALLSGAMATLGGLGTAHALRGEAPGPARQSQPPALAADVLARLVDRSRAAGGEPSAQARAAAGPAVARLFDPARAAQAERVREAQRPVDPRLATGEAPDLGKLDPAVVRELEQRDAAAARKAAEDRAAFERQHDPDAIEPSPDMLEAVGANRPVAYPPEAPAVLVPRDLRLQTPEEWNAVLKQRAGGAFEKLSQDETRRIRAFIQPESPPGKAYTDLGYAVNRRFKTVDEARAFLQGAEAQAKAARPEPQISESENPKTAPAPPEPAPAPTIERATVDPGEVDTLLRSAAEDLAKPMSPEERVQLARSSRVEGLLPSASKKGLYGLERVEAEPQQIARAIREKKGPLYDQVRAEAERAIRERKEAAQDAGVPDLGDAAEVDGDTSFDFADEPAPSAADRAIVAARPDPALGHETLPPQDWGGEPRPLAGRPAAPPTPEQGRAAVGAARASALPDEAPMYAVRRGEGEDYSAAWLKGRKRGQPGISADLERGDGSGELVFRDASGTPVGVAAFTGRAVTDIAVSPKARRQGVGRALLKAAAERGVQEVRGPFTPHGRALAEASGLRLVESADHAIRQTAAERRAAELEQFRQQAQRLREETATGPAATDRGGAAILAAMDNVRPLSRGAAGQSPTVGVPELWEATKGQFRDRAEFDQALLQLQRDGRIGTSRGDTGLSPERAAASTPDPYRPGSQIMAVHKLGEEPSAAVAAAAPAPPAPPAPTAATTPDLVRRRFAGFAKIEDDPGGGQRLRFRDGGPDLVIRETGHIEIDPRAMAKHGEAAAGAEVVGETRRIGPDVVVRLLRGEGMETLGHEEFHAAMRAARLSEKEVAAVQRRFEAEAKREGQGRHWEELAAEEYGRQAAERHAAIEAGKPAPRTEGWVSRVYEFFRRVWRSYRPDAQSAFDRIHSGEVYGKEAGAAAEAGEPSAAIRRPAAATPPAEPPGKRQGILDPFLKQSTSILRDAGGAARQLAERIDAASEDAQLGASGAIRQLQEARSSIFGKKGPTPEQFRRVVDYLEGGRAPSDRSLRQYGDTIRQILGKAYDDAAAAGVDVGKRERNYFPRQRNGVFDFEQAAADLAAERGITRLEAEEQLAEARSRAPGGVANLEKERTDTRRAGQAGRTADYRTDEAVLVDYLKRTYQRAAEATHLDAGGKRLGLVSQLLSKIADDRVKKTAKHIVEQELGLGKLPGFGDDAGKLALSFNAVRQLGGLGFINQITTIAPTVAKAGFRSSARGLIDYAKNRPAAELRAMAATFGNATEELAAQLGKEAPTRALPKDASLAERAVHGASQATAKVASVLPTMRAIGSIDRWQRVVADSVGRAWVKDRWEAARRGDQVAARDVRALGADPTKPLDEAALARAGKRFSDETQGDPSPRNLPPFWSTGTGKVLFQYLPFMYRMGDYTGKVVRAAAGELAHPNSGRGFSKVGELSRLIVLSGIAGQAAIQLRQLASGIGINDPQDPKEWTDVFSSRAIDLRKAPVQAAVQSWLRAGVGGMAQVALERLSSDRGRTGADKLVGFVGGPTTSSAVEAYDAGTKIQKAYQDRGASGAAREVAATAADQLVPGYGRQIGSEIRAGAEPDKASAHPGWVGRFRDTMRPDPYSPSDPSPASGSVFDVARYRRELAARADARDARTRSAEALRSAGVRYEGAGASPLEGAASAQASIRRDEVIADLSRKKADLEARGNPAGELSDLKRKARRAGVDWRRLNLSSDERGRQERERGELARRYAQATTTAERNKVMREAKRAGYTLNYRALREGRLELE